MKNKKNTKIVILNLNTIESYLTFISKTHAKRCFLCF